MATTVRHPNRERPAAQATRSVVVLLLLVSAGLVFLIDIAGWKVLEGDQLAAILFALLYLLLAFYIGRWSRGALAVTCGLTLLVALVSISAVPAWFERTKTGFVDPLLPASLVGTLTVMTAVVQVLLFLFAARGFRQEWQVEIEVDEQTGAATQREGMQRPKPPRSPQSQGSTQTATQASTSSHTTATHPQPSGEETQIPPPWRDRQPETRRESGHPDGPSAS
jgi:lysylphosphatidylglycerol synthetase-like protein (DUF2156 family)